MKRRAKIFDNKIEMKSIYLKKKKNIAQKCLLLNWNYNETSFKISGKSSKVLKVAFNSIAIF